MKRKFLFGILVCVLLLTCCISDNGETTTTTPSSKTVKVDPKDFMLDSYEMPPTYTIVVDKYLDEDRLPEWAVEYDTQGGYWREFEGTGELPYLNIFCYLFPSPRIQDVFQYVKGYEESSITVSSTKKDFELVSSPDIGDDTFAFQYKYLYDEQWLTMRRLYFIKQNIMMCIMGTKDVSWDDIIEVAEKVAEKIPDKEMELSEKAKSATQTPRPTTAPPATAVPTTTSPTTTPPTTTAAPTTTPPATTPAPTHITLTGGMNEPLDDGKLYVVVWSVFKSDYGGYWVEVFFENSSEGNILWKPTEIKIIDAKDDSYKNRVEYSYIKSGSKDYLSVIEQILDPDEGFRLVLEFSTGMYLPKTFILTNEYSDGSTTTWEIRLKL